MFQTATNCSNLQQLNQQDKMIFKIFCITGIYVVLYRERLLAAARGPNAPTILQTRIMCRKFVMPVRISMCQAHGYIAFMSSAIAQRPVQNAFMRLSLLFRGSDKMPTEIKVWSFHKSISVAAKEDLLKHFGARTVQHVGQHGRNDAVLARLVHFKFSDCPSS